MTLSITTFSITTFSTMTFSIMTLSVKGLFVPLSINDTQQNTLYAIMLGVVMMSFAIYVLNC